MRKVRVRAGMEESGDGGAFAAEPTAVSLAGASSALERTNKKEKKTDHQMETIMLTGGDSASDCGAAAVIRGKRKRPK